MTQILLLGNRTSLLSTLHQRIPRQIIVTGIRIILDKMLTGALFFWGVILKKCTNLPLPKKNILFNLDIVVGSVTFHHQSGVDLPLLAAASGRTDEGFEEGPSRLVPFRSFIHSVSPSV